LLLLAPTECGRTTVQEERGTDDRGSLAVFAAIRRASSVIKAEIGRTRTLVAKS
jgi:hypothetical protein